MNLKYILSQRTNGANPFKVFEAIRQMNQSELDIRIRSLEYGEFLKTAYWFAVASVAKSNARMRCQVCNGQDQLSVHHRTYDTHGREHENMCDLVALCRHCHGLFHGHLPPKPEPTVVKRLSGAAKWARVIPHESVDSEIPDEPIITLTPELINRCRANGAFTTASARALGISRDQQRIRGWVSTLIGKQMRREDFKKAVEARYIYSGCTKNLPS